MPASILLIDSDPSLVYLLGRYAEECGFSLSYAPSVQAAHELLSHERIALLVFNRLLMAAAGQVALAALRRTIAARDIPVASFSQASAEPGPPALDTDYELALPLLYGDFCQALAALGIEWQAHSEGTHGE